MTGEVRVAPKGTPPPLGADMGRLWVVPEGMSLRDLREPWHFDFGPGRPYSEQERLYIEHLRRMGLGPRTIASYLHHLPPRIVTGKAQPMHPLDTPQARAAAATERLRAYFEGAAPAFDSRLTNGARIKLKHKTRDDVHEFTARVLIHNGLRIIGVRPSATGPRFDASEYTLTILAPALPATAGLYTTKRANGRHVVYRLKAGGGWLRWDTSRDIMETTTAYSVGREVGPDGLVELTAATS